jgi:hypothetical protein
LPPWNSSMCRQHRLFTMACTLGAHCSCNQACGPCVLMHKCWPACQVPKLYRLRSAAVPPASDTISLGPTPLPATPPVGAAARLG